MDRLLNTLRGFDGVLELAPAEGSAFPEIAWGDHFFYYAPDGQVPQREQPYATIITKNYPGDAASDLDRPGRWRLNIHVGTETFAELTGENPGDGAATPWDYAATDAVFPHPVYRAQGWVSIINPDPSAHAPAARLLRRAHEDARRRAERRSAASRAAGGTDPAAAG
ncbi:DUF6194 family protein [Streptomyces sp. ODS28]|uniref:DUF6194 family protein n=1 Tax=Streptomyces sp. ODS28 TaxID=3136688 RepID=UPI0031EC35AE